MDSHTDLNLFRAVCCVALKAPTLTSAVLVTASEAAVVRSSNSWQQLAMSRLRSPVNPGVVLARTEGS